VRLTEKQLTAIQDAIQQSVPDAEPYLFGSRTDDSARGGDIDLMLLTQEKLPLRQLLSLRRKILQKIGDQKVDLVNFSKQSDAPFKTLILKTAVRL